MTLAPALAIMAGVAAAAGLVALVRYVRRIDKDLLNSTAEASDDAQQRQAQLGIGLTSGGGISH